MHFSKFQCISTFCVWSCSIVDQYAICGRCKRPIFQIELSKLNILPDISVIAENFDDCQDFGTVGYRKWAGFVEIVIICIWWWLLFSLYIIVINSKGIYIITEESQSTRFYEFRYPSKFTATILVSSKNWNFDLNVFETTDLLGLVFV